MGKIALSTSFKISQSEILNRLATQNPEFRLQISNPSSREVTIARRDLKFSHEIWAFDSAIFTEKDSDILTYFWPQREL